jgi:hypothetical protein
MEYEQHRRAMLARARELVLALNRTQYNNWEQYIQQLAIVNTQIQALATQIYGTQASVHRFRDAAVVLLPLTEQFPVQELLPAKPDLPNINTHNADSASLDYNYIAAADRDALEVIKYATQKANSINSNSTETKTNIKAKDQSKICTTILSGALLR